MSRVRLSTMLVLGLTLAGTASAAAAMNSWEWLNLMDRRRASQAAQDAPWVNAKVTRADKARGTLTISHGPVPSIGMGAMLMSYAAADPSVLASLKRGDHVKVRLSTRDGVARILDLAK